MSRKPRFGRGAIAAVLVSLALSAFAPAASAPFVSDDKLAISMNEYVVEGSGLYDIFANFSWWGSLRADAPGYRPLVTLTYVWTWSAAGADPFSFHIVNLGLHALVVWLCFLLAIRLGCDTNAAFWSAALFAVLPIHSEAVIWNVGRAELMAAAAWATTLIALIDYRQRGKPPALALAGGALLAGLFCKENAITVLAAPVVLAVIVPLPTRRKQRDYIVLATLVLVTLAYLGLRASIGPVVPGKAPDSLDNPLSGLGAAARMAGALAVFGRYLWLTVWPNPLSVDYSYDALGISEGFIGDRYALLGVAAVVGLIALILRTYKTQPAITVATIMAVASYSIVSNSVILIGTVMGERLFYLPTLGICIALGPAMARLTKARGRDAAYANPGVWGLATLLAALLIVDWQRAQVWNDPVTLFESAAAAHPRSARAQMELGSAYAAVGRTEEAIDAFDKSVDVRPNYGAAWYNMANLYARSGRNEKAIEIYDVALQHAPKLVPAWFNLGMVHRAKGDHARAQGAFATAVELAPHDGESQMAYADTLLMLGRNQEAVVAYTAALDAGVFPASAQINRGVALERSAGCQAALPDYLALARSMPPHRTALSNAVNCLRALNRGAEADQLLANARVANENSGR